MVKSFDVVTFGSAVMDNFVFTDTSTRSGSFVYEVGSKYLIDEHVSDVGGGGTNTAVAFSRLGFSTGCVCGLGDDAYGKNTLSLLKKEGVSFLGKKSSVKTGFSVILDSRSHSRTILTFKGASNEVSLSSIPSFKTKWLYCSSLLGKSFSSQKVLAKRLKEDGSKVAFNPSAYHIRNTDLSSFLKVVDILILNKEEALMLAKKHSKSKDYLRVLSSLGPSIVVVTDKNKLIEAFDGVKRYTLKPHKIKVVERTGAGDAFASGFVAGIAAGYSVDKALALGLRESESVIRHFGAKNKLLRLKIKR